MKRSAPSPVHSLAWIFACASALALVPPFASADEPSVAEWTLGRVQEGLLKPLAARETQRSRFSRARPPPRERRVRVLQPTATLDKNGRPFVPFAVDVRFGTDWTEDDIVGCVYRGSGKLFVRYGDLYRPASMLLGKEDEPVAGVCEAAPPPS